MAKRGPNGGAYNTWPLTRCGPVCRAADASPRTGDPRRPGTSATPRPGVADRWRRRRDPSTKRSRPGGARCGKGTGDRPRYRSPRAIPLHVNQRDFATPRGQGMATRTIKIGSMLPTSSALPTDSRWGASIPRRRGTRCASKKTGNSSWGQGDPSRQLSRRRLSSRARHEGVERPQGHFARRNRWARTRGDDRQGRRADR